MIKGVHHTGINTADLDRTVAFYRKVGFEIVHEGGWENNPLVDESIGLTGSAARVAMLRAAGTFLEFFEYRAPAARDTQPLRPCDRGFTHICLEVEDIEAEHDRLTAAGLTFFRRPADVGAIKMVYGKDPDGNLVEILEVKDKAHPFARP